MPCIGDRQRQNLPELSAAMVAQLEPEGLDRSVKVAVQWVVWPVADTDRSGAALGFPQVVLLPRILRESAI